MPNVIVWADIPVTDMERAKRFYEHVTGDPVMDMPGPEGGGVAVLGSGQEGEMVVSADLYTGGTPSADGPTIYLGANGDIDGMVQRAREAGGTILQEKQFMGDMVGWIAFVLDTEGNRIGFQQPAQGT